MSQGSPFHAPPAEMPSLISGITVDSHVEYEHAADGAPLVISFGFYVAGEPASFTFSGRLKKLEKITGRPINKLLVRDPALQWYLGGVQGVGDDVPSTVRAIQELIDWLEPSAVITVGQSMGAYAAILFGTLLDVDKVISFGPVSAFDRHVWTVIGETRWLPVLAELEESGLDVSPHHDLPPLLLASEARPDIDLIFGADPGEGAVGFEAVGIDAAHAARFIGIPNVSLLPAAHSGHAVVEYFRATGVITEVLDQRIFGTSLLPTIQAMQGDAWVAWALENAVAGVPFTELRRTVLQSNMPAETQSVLGRAKVLSDLKRLEDSPPATVVA